MSLVFTAKELVTELEKPSPDNVLIQELISNLYTNIYQSRSVEYVSHLWDLTFADTKIGPSTKDWYLHWAGKEIATGYRNLRFSYIRGRYKFVKSNTKYDRCLLKDIPQNIYHDHDFDSNYYDAIEGYIRKNCDLNSIDTEWHREPYLV
jgi:hypothetical protein